MDVRVYLFVCARFVCTLGRPSMHETATVWPDLVRKNGTSKTARIYTDRVKGYGFRV
jgi:hypothetical protein